MSDITPTPEEITPLDARRAEVASYDDNITMYQSIAAQLPTEWPARLEQFRGRKDHQAAAAEVQNLNDVALLAQLLFAEQCQAAIRTEMLERTKAAAILAAMEANAG
jgi:hypothetical protein